MFKKSVNPNANPLRALRTAADFHAISPGATCKKLQYDQELSVFVLKLADGSTLVVAGNEESAWDRGVEMLENGHAPAPAYVRAPKCPEALAAQ